jgi:uncharacterized UPF0146 family protein
MSTVLIILTLTVIGIPTFFILADFLHKKQFEVWVIEIRMRQAIEKLGLSEEHDDD